jgi:hypothetical protein
MHTFYALLSSLTVADIKRLLVHFPHLAKVGRKDVLATSIYDEMDKDGWHAIWNRLDPCQRLAVTEAAHREDGVFDARRFAARYGQLPLFVEEGPSASYYQETLTPLCLFLFRVDGHYELPHDLHPLLKARTAEPRPDALITHANPPAMVDGKLLTVRATEQEALHDVVVMLRAAESGAIAVSEKTRLPGLAAQRLVAGKLANGDFYAIETPPDQWTQVCGAIKAMAWPILLQAAGLAGIKGGKLALTTAGLQATAQRPADAVRNIWRTWLSSTFLDEFSRLDVLKGQKSKGLRMSPLGERRAMVAGFLRRCPVGQWLQPDELLRFMRAEGKEISLCNHIGFFHIEEARYGELMDTAENDLMLQLRYLLCVLLEYCAPLGMVDVAYTPPQGARGDYAGLWGADDLAFLTRYDGLALMRLTPLGAYCLGLDAAYAAPARAAGAILSVRANLHIAVTSGALAPEDMLLLDHWASRETDTLWRLDRQKALAAVERGQDSGQLQQLLEAGDSQPLPPQVESFLRTCNKNGKAMKVEAASLLIACADSATADLIASHKELDKLCMRAGESHLVVRTEREEAFRKAVRRLGYGMLI